MRMTNELRRPRAGLSPRQVQEARRAHGENRFSEAKRRGFWRRFFANLGDPVIKVLLAALAVNLLLLFRGSDWFETVGIAVSVFLATFISTLSEYGSEAAFSRLCESCGTAYCRVRRGKVTEIPVGEVVVGDVVLLSPGDRIPADGVIFEGKLFLDQSALTGESREAEKYPAAVRGDLSPDSPAGLFAGCTVLAGEGEMEVTRVGDATMLGGISGELQQEGGDSPLKHRLTRLARQISVVGYIAAALCVAAFLFDRLIIDSGFSGAVLLSRLRDLPFLASLLLNALTLGLTVVVMAVPEGNVLLV